MTNLHLLGVAKVRRSLTIPIIVFTLLNAAAHAGNFKGEWWWIVPAYVLFDSMLWIGVAFLIFAVVERRQRVPPQPRLAAMVLATGGMAALATSIISVRALFESIDSPEPYVTRWLRYLPAGFYAATFYVAIVTGIAYGVYSWAVDERRLAEAAELDAAIARAELNTLSARLQPEAFDAALARIAAVVAIDVPAAQRLIANLGAQLHESLAERHSAPAASGTTARDSRRRPARVQVRRSG